MLLFKNEQEQHAHLVEQQIAYTNQMPFLATVAAQLRALGMANVGLSVQTERSVICLWLCRHFSFSTTSTSKFGLIQ